jgi:hypothetical protein
MRLAIVACTLRHDRWNGRGKRHDDSGRESAIATYVSSALRFVSAAF